MPPVLDEVHDTKGKTSWALVWCDVQTGGQRL